MILFHEKGIDAAEGAKEGLICTPYYSERGLQVLDPFFNTAEKVEFWTRFSPRDWIAGVADMTALKRRVQSTLFPQFVNEIANTSSDLLYDFPDNSVHKEWIEFLCSHTDEIDEEQKFSFRTLMNYLPPSVGGICIGGGGASPTLKRVLPIVARMLQTSGKYSG